MNILAIDLGGTVIKLGLVRDGELAATRKCEAKSSGGLRPRLPEIQNGFESICSEQDLGFSDCQGIGVSCPGLVDGRSRRVVSTNEKYEDVVDFDLEGWAEERFGLPLRLENDAHAALLGEWQYGAGRGVDNAVMLTLGTGIGCSVLLQGRPLRGKHWQAGLLGGHIIVNPDGHPCTCPCRGCAEAEASTWALPSLVREHPGYAESELSRLPSVDYQTLFQLAGRGDAAAKDIRDRSLYIWGATVVSLIHLFDPERVILGGGIMHSADIIIPWIQQFVDENAWIAWGRVEVVRAEYLDTASLLGASALFEKDFQFL